MNDRTILKDFTKSKFFAVLIVVLVVSTIAFAGIAVYEYRQQSIMNSDLGSLTGTATIEVTDPNGTVSFQVSEDAITTNAYDWAACVMFGVSTNACGAAYVYENNLFPYTTFTTTATISSFLPYMNFLNGIGLANYMQSNSLCGGLLTGNGLSPQVATVTHVGGQNSPLVTMTASWTYTGTSQAVSSVCLMAGETSTYIPQFTSTVVTTNAAGNNYNFAYENFSSQTLTTGQSITVTWSFNM